MKTNISILVNVEGVTIREGAHDDAIRWLADAIRIGMGIQYAHYDMPVRPVECDENNGVITIKEAPMVPL
jgi:hypothetical protein